VAPPPPPPTGCDTKQYFSSALSYLSIKYHVCLLYSHIFAVNIDLKHIFPAWTDFPRRLCELLTLAVYVSAVQQSTRRASCLTCRCCRQSSAGGTSSPGQTPPLRWCTGRSCHTGCRRAAGSPLYRCTRQSGGRNPSAPSHSRTLNRQRKTSLARFVSQKHLQHVFNPLRWHAFNMWSVTAWHMLPLWLKPLFDANIHVNPLTFWFVGRHSNNNHSALCVCVLFVGVDLNNLMSVLTSKGLIL